MNDEGENTGEITILMAYSDDYTIGKLCESVNREYAARHGYNFVSHVNTCDEILEWIRPKLHMTWFKIYLLRQLMRDALLRRGYSELELNEMVERAGQQAARSAGGKDTEKVSHSIEAVPSEGREGREGNDSLSTELDEPIGSENSSSSVKAHITSDYLFWIDGDAMVCYHELKVEQIITEGHCKELIIAEDMHKLNPINAGVFLLKVCPWSFEFLESTWLQKKYDAKFYYEQSAMTKALRYRRQGLHFVQPFHSFDGGPQDVKLFPNVAVFPLALFSSNALLTVEEGDAIAQQYEKEISARLNDGVVDGVESVFVGKSNSASDFGEESSGALVRPLYIFHPAGMRSKLNLLKAAIIKYGLPCPFMGNNEWLNMRFKLHRNTLGHVVGPFPVKPKST